MQLGLSSFYFLAVRPILSIYFPKRSIEFTLTDLRKYAITLPNKKPNNTKLSQIIISVVLAITQNRPIATKLIQNIPDVFNSGKNS